MSASPAAAQTVGAVLQRATERLRASGSESPRLDAEVLLGFVLGVDRTAVIAHSEAPVGIGQAETFAALLARRETGEPVAYIRGFKEFHGLAFFVDPRALIPRPETELLVDLAVDRVREVLTSAPRDATAGPFRIWDVGTGSGAIAISVAKALAARGYGNAIRVRASDVSADALALAVENAVGHGMADQIDFGLGDLLTVEPAPSGRADLLVANLPYIPTAAVPHLPVAASFEPVVALDGGGDGLDLIRRLLPDLLVALGPSGAAILEIGSEQADAAVAAAATALPGWTARVVADLGGRPRALRLEAPGPSAPT